MIEKYLEVLAEYREAYEQAISATEKLDKLAGRDRELVDEKELEVKELEGKTFYTEVTRLYRTGYKAGLKMAAELAEIYLKGGEENG